jgi:hypothetical protein
MNIPGLSAESSLYRSSALYRSARAPVALPCRREIVPQLPIGFCMPNCDRIQDDFLRSVCELKCLEQPPPPQPPRPPLHSFVRALYPGPGVAVGWV